MALLLIDNRTPDIPCILQSLESNVTPIIFDFENETFESLSEKIPQQRFTHLGILQDNPPSNTYCMIKSFGQSILRDVAVLDPKLETWTSFHLFIELCVSRLGINFLDLIDCNLTNDWDYLSQQWNIVIRYSSGIIGGTQWYLNQVPLIGLYFTEDIKKYPHTFGEAAETQVSVIDYLGRFYLFGLETYTGPKFDLVYYPTFVSTSISMPSSVRHISTGAKNTLLTMNNKTVYGYGQDNGELGLTLGTIYTTPTIIPITGVTMTSQGDQFGLYLKDTGTVFGTGKNTYGALGINSSTDQIGTFVQSNISNVSAISCAANYSCFLTTTGDVYGCGKDNGQFGTGDLLTPTSIITQIKHVATGEKHMVLHYDNNNVFCRGDNFYGQLGNGTTTNSSTPVQVLTSTDSVPLTDIRSIDANDYMSLAIDAIQQLWVWGYLPDQTTTNKALMIQTGVEWAKIFKNGILYVKNNVYYVTYGTAILFPMTDGTLLYPNGTSIYYHVPLAASICFLAGTPIVTDQGIIPIDHLVPGEHTICNRDIVAITHTLSLDKELICFEKDALRKNYPTQKTVMSRLHKIYYKGKMKAAYHFLGKYKGVYSIPYEKQILFNVLMKEYDTMNVNGFICETLNPVNPITKYFL